MSEACKECSRLWDKPLPPQSGCNECYDLLRDFTKALEAKNVELESKIVELEVCESLHKLNIERLQKKLEIAVEALRLIAEEYYGSSIRWSEASIALAAIKGA